MAFAHIIKGGAEPNSFLQFFKVTTGLQKNKNKIIKNKMYTHKSTYVYLT